MLPLEILVLIGITDPWAWRTLLAIPDFARWTQSNQARKMKHNLIIKKKNKDAFEFYLGTKLHNFDDLPASVNLTRDLQYWYKNGLRHRDADLPAVIYGSESKQWFQNGLFHRDNDMPAIIWSTGSQEWYQRGLLHRDNDEPAIIYADGTQYWYQNNLLHRDNDKPAVIRDDGSWEWYQHGLRHRDNDKPAIIHQNGSGEWYQNGRLQRKIAHRRADLQSFRQC